MRQTVSLLNFPLRIAVFLSTLYSELVPARTRRLKLLLRLTAAKVHCPRTSCSSLRQQRDSATVRELSKLCRYQY